VAGLASGKLVDIFTPLATNIAGQIALLLLLAAVLASVMLCEHQPLASIGIRPPKLSSLVCGLLLAAFFVFIYSPALFWVLKRLGHSGFEGGLSRLALLPAWYRMLAVLIGGAVEEILYRGFAIERIAELSGRRWLGALVALALFTFAHLGYWGWPHLIVAGCAGMVLTALYLLRRDLTSNVVAHWLTDAVAFLLG